MRKCVTCEISKVNELFTGISRVCNDCKAKTQLKIQQRELLKNQPSRPCSKCHKDTPKDKFKDDTHVCLECYNRRRRELKAAKRPSKPQPINPNNQICIMCKKELDPSNFRTYLSTAKNLLKRTECKDCEKKMGRDYRKSDVGKEKSKKWVEKNADRMKQLLANWFQKNKSRINEKTKKRLKEDFLFKLKATLGNRLRSALKSKSKEKNQVTMEYINCTIDFVKDWFESCFEEGMTFENHGDYWHIDHVIPIDTFKFDTEEDFKLAFSWFNLMPITKEKNLSKNKYIDLEQLEKHVDNLFNCGDYSDLEEYFNLCATHLDAGIP